MDTTETEEREGRRPEFYCILSTMRSGTTLLGHLLSESRQVRFAGETHRPLTSEKGVAEAVRVISAEEPTSQTNKLLPFCDKVVGKRLLGDGVFFSQRTDRIFILLRHPLAVWRSLKATGWTWARFDYLEEQLRIILQVVRLAAPEKVVAITYYELTNKEGRARLFGRESDEYSTLSKTGKPDWGDMSKLISSGRVRNRTLEEELAGIEDEIRAEMNTPEASGVWQAFHELATRLEKTELLVDCPVDSKGLVFGESASSSLWWKLGWDDLERLMEKKGSLAYDSDDFNFIYTEDILQRMTILQAQHFLRECNRLLSGKGVLRISTPNIRFAAHLASGSLSEIAEQYVHWYIDEHLPNSPGYDGVIVANSLMRDWANQFLHDELTLQALLVEAGFTEVKIVRPSESDHEELRNLESVERLPSGLYGAERFVMEGSRGGCD